jgi:SAM-dependent methyltransferase
MTPLSDDRARFCFGKNWLSYVDDVDEQRIERAKMSLQALVALNRFDNCRFLDIGSGSGLFSLAARRLGARVYSFDYDAHSVDATKRLKSHFLAEDRDWTIEQGSVLDHRYLGALGLFDIVYSWGVLHHTGAMIEAMRNAATNVAPGGLFVFAVYRRTRLCPFWKVEKRWYARSSPAMQRLARAIFVSLMGLALLAKRRNFRTYIREYRNNRGMDCWHDVHDWLGGYPYESIAPKDVARLMAELGFYEERSNTRSYSMGIFGSGCDEYVYRRAAVAT